MKLKLGLLDSYSSSRKTHHSQGFTRVDLVAAMLILGILSLLALPAIARGPLASLAASCVENQRQITLAWQQYAADHNDRLVNNYTIPDTEYTISLRRFDTWAPNVLDWSTNPENTNETYLQKGRLFPYLQGNTFAFKCPADTYLSPAQIAAGWTRRIRSYSMNAVMGKSGDSDLSIYDGRSAWITGKRQFLKTVSIPDPANTIVFLDEHPDSISDGFFIGAGQDDQWSDFPGSHHAGGCGIGYADGHGEIHSWLYSATKAPVLYNVVSPPAISPSTSDDYLWLTSRLSVDPTTLAIHTRTNAIEIAWSSLPTNYVLEASSDPSTLNWTPVPPKPIADYGTKSVIIDSSNSASFFRLHKY